MAVLVVVLVMPVLQVYGASMNPLLSEGDFVVSIKTADLKLGTSLHFIIIIKY